MIHTNRPLLQFLFHHNDLILGQIKKTTFHHSTAFKVKFPKCLYQVCKQHRQPCGSGSSSLANIFSDGLNPFFMWDLTFVSGKIKLTARMLLLVFEPVVSLSSCCVQVGGTATTLASTFFQFSPQKLLESLIHSRHPQEDPD